MRTSLGVSAGSAIVCSALLTTAEDGGQTIEYRTVSVDENAPDLGELVASSIELMTTQIPGRTVRPSGIAVAYRSTEQVQSIRAAVARHRHDLQLVPESAAALKYLHSTGEVARYETVAIVDLGATGLTVTLVDQADATVLDSQRTTEVSGDAIDAAVSAQLERRRSYTARPDRDVLAARVRTAKEQLSTENTVTVEFGSRAPLELTLAEFDSITEPVVDAAVTFTAQVLDGATRRPDAIVLIGGGANIAAVRRRLRTELRLPVLRPEEPEAVIAKGAALLADSRQPLPYPVVSLAADAPTSTFTKVAGAMVGVLIVVGLIIGYGVQALGSPAHENVSPAGAGNARTEVPVPATTSVTIAPSTAAPVEETTVAPTYEYSEPVRTDSSDFGPTTTVPAQGFPTTTTVPTTTRTSVPSLRPGPDLPPVLWPDTAPEESAQSPDFSQSPLSTQSSPSTDDAVPGSATPSAPQRNIEQAPAEPPVSTSTEPAPPPPLFPLPNTGSFG